VAVVRGQMLSVVPLAAILGLENTPSTHLVIVELAGGNRFALGFSGITDHEELVVRPTAPHLAALGVFAGQTLQDNGVPVLVIDAAGVAAKAGIDGPDRISASNTPAQPVAITPPSILIFEGLDGIRRAVRAGQIDHIDDVVAGDFVVRGDIAFVKTDDGLIPAILDGPLPDHGQVALLQLSVDGRPVGYPVSGVQDLAPLPLITPVADGIVEGFVLIDGEAVALLQWPRSAPVKRRARA
jgi:two-component system, chemotaxis family, sensor kinase CheA